MPDDGIVCALGRLEQKMESFKEDLAEVKKDNKDVKEYIDNQKNGFRLFWGAIAAFGALVAFSKDIIDSIGSLKNLLLKN